MQKTAKIGIAYCPERCGLRRGPPGHQQGLTIYCCGLRANQAPCGERPANAPTVKHELMRPSWHLDLWPSPVPSLLVSNHQAQISDNNKTIKEFPHPPAPAPSLW